MARYLSSTQWLRWTLSYPIEEQGHSPSQWVLWTLSYPVHETDRPAELPVVLNTHPLQADFQQSCPLQLVHRPGFTGWCQSG